jgi:hypothetical protein
VAADMQLAAARRMERCWHARACCLRCPTPVALEWARARSPAVSRRRSATAGRIWSHELLVGNARHLARLACGAIVHLCPDCAPQDLVAQAEDNTVFSLEHEWWPLLLLLLLLQCPPAQALDANARSWRLAAAIRCRLRKQQLRFPSPDVARGGSVRGTQCLIAKAMLQQLRYRTRLSSLHPLLLTARRPALHPTWADPPPARTCLPAAPACPGF